MAILMLTYVQVVQINNNESSSSEKKETIAFYCRQAKDMQACQKKQNILIRKSSWQDTQGAQIQCRLSH